MIMVLYSLIHSLGLDPNDLLFFDFRLYNLVHTFVSSLEETISEIIT